MTPFNCARHSAWHDWQNAGATWITIFPNAEPSDIAAASHLFGSNTNGIGNREAAYQNRAKAFLEGVKNSYNGSNLT